MAEHVPGVWEDEVAAYDAGRMGSRRLMELEMSMIDVAPEALLATAAAQPHDPGFVPFVRRAQAARIPIEIVSDGFGFFIEPALEALGVRGAAGRHGTDHLRRAGARRSRSRTATRRCFVCGTCKRNRVLAHQAAGSARSSSSATARATDMPPATATSCGPNARSSGSASRPAGRTSAGPSSARSRPGWSRRGAWHADAASLDGPRPHPFFCGPEVWGDGLFDPCPTLAA